MEHTDGHGKGCSSETFSAYITIEGPVFYDSSISDRAKLLYGLICAMTQAPRYYAYAKNETMARYLRCNIRTVQRCLQELENAGHILIEEKAGGRSSLRIIRPARLQPKKGDKNVMVNHDKNVTPINKEENKPRRNKKAAAESEILEWLDGWAVRLEGGMELTTPLISDLHAFFDCRKAKNKPILTINAAGRSAKKLENYTAGYPVEIRIPMMRYILGESIEHNWEKLYPIKPENRDDFSRWCADNYDGMQVQFLPEEASEKQEYF